MIIRVDAVGDVRVDEHHLFTDFRVEAPSGVAGEELVVAMGEDTRAEGDYLWIAEAGVRRWLAGQVDEAWEEGFAKMVGYARSKGWTLPANTHLRAHLENPDGYWPPIDT